MAVKPTIRCELCFMHNKWFITAKMATIMRTTLFFSKSLFANFFTWILCPYYILHSSNKLRTQSRHYSNSIATNGAGVCQYDITNATANYNAVSMTTLGHQFKDKQIIIATWMHKKNWQKGARNLERFSFQVSSFSCSKMMVFWFKFLWILLPMNGPINHKKRR